MTGSRRPRPRRWRLAFVLMVGLVAMVAWASIAFDPFGTAGRAYRRGEFAAALKASEAHLTRRPEDRAASLMAARCSKRFGQLLRAEQHYRNAGTLDRDDLRDRAYGLVMLHAPNRAIEAYGELVTRYPDDAEALKHFAALLMDQKQFAAAGELGGRLVELPGQEVPGRTLVGIAHHVLKEYEQASEDFERILRLDPGLEAMPLPPRLFWDHLAIDLMAQGRDSEARSHLLRALDRGEDAELIELLGLTYYREGATVDAERCWRRVVELDPRNANAWLDLGRMALSRRPAEAVALLEKGAELAPGSIDAQHNLALAYRLAGDPLAANRCLRRASELRGRHHRRGAAVASPDGDRAGPGREEESGS